LLSVSSNFPPSNQAYSLQGAVSIEDAVDLNLNIGVLDGFGIVVNQSE
jgi:hypothetical protein